MSRPALFFDLAGTLIDSASGMTRCVAPPLAQLAHPGPAGAAPMETGDPALPAQGAPGGGKGQPQ